MRRAVAPGILETMFRALVVAIALAAGGGRPALPAPCGGTCAAYRAIAEALPADRSGALARAIVATPGFDYARLARSLRIPTTTDVRRGWPAFCRRRFRRDPASALRCDALLLGSTPQGGGPDGIWWSS